MEAPSLASSGRLNQAGRKLKDKNGSSSCDNPSEMQDDDFLPDITIPGAVVWAKQDNFTWWPGIVGGSPYHEEYRKREKNGQEFLHVNFFGDKVWHAWVKEDKITPFVPNPMSKQMKHMFTVGKKNQPHFKRATRQAKYAFDMDIQKRINYFRLAVFYQRKWPKPDIFESPKVEVDSNVRSNQQNDVLSEGEPEEHIDQEPSKVQADSNIQSNQLPICDDVLSNSNNEMEPEERPSDIPEASEPQSAACESSPEPKRRKFILDEETLDSDNPNFRKYTYLK